MSLTQPVQYQGYIPQLVRKCIPSPTGLQRMDDRNAVKKYQVKKAHFFPLCKCSQKWLKSVFHFAVKNNRISFSMVCVFFMHNFFYAKQFRFAGQKQMLNESKGTNPTMPGPISHNASFCKNRYAHCCCNMVHCGLLV